jgi:F-type H+-transporting ATPase subunit epsilon
MAVLPAVHGRQGVMSGHDDMIVTLKMGIVDIYQKDRIDQQFFIVGGVMKITAKEILVVTDEATDIKDIDLDRAREAVASTAAILEQVEEDATEIEFLERELAKNQAIVYAVEHKYH